VRRAVHSFKGTTAKLPLRSPWSGSAIAQHFSVSEVGKMALENILRRQVCIRLADDGGSLIYTVKYGGFCLLEDVFTMTDEFQREFAAEFSKLRQPIR
jgi:hypothetical protein